jgi:hypothetical protein
MVRWRDRRMEIGRDGEKDTGWVKGMNTGMDGKTDTAVDGELDAGMYE